MSFAVNPKEMRRASRQDVCFRCEIAGADLARFSALIVNISPFGCLMRCSQPVAQDGVVHFTLPLAGRVEARVVWAMGGRVGVEFVTPIDTNPYLAMLKQLDRPADEMGIY